MSSSSSGADSVGGTEAVRAGRATDLATTAGYDLFEGILGGPEAGFDVTKAGRLSSSLFRLALLNRSGASREALAAADFFDSRELAGFRTLPRRFSNFAQPAFESPRNPSSSSPTLISDFIPLRSSFCSAPEKRQKQVRFLGKGLPCSLQGALDQQKGRNESYSI